MESTIFTPSVIDQIDKFIQNEVYLGVIDDFEVTDSHDFDRAVEDAAAGQTEFEIEIETLSSHDEEFYDLISRFVDSYVIDQDCQVYTKIDLELDKDANTLEVTACFDLLPDHAFLPKSEWKLLTDGKVIDVKEYRSQYGRVIIEDYFTAIGEFDSWNDTSKSMIISLDNQIESEKENENY